MIAISRDLEVKQAQINMKLVTTMGLFVTSLNM